MENWLKERNLFKEHEKHKELVKRIKRKRSPEEFEKIKQYQIKLVKKDTDEFMKFLEKHNLKQDQIQEIEDILKDYDPHFKQRPRSCYLYDYIWYGGSVLKLRSGYQYCGTRYAMAYPDLGVFNFDNKANSVKFNCNSYAYLYAGKNYEKPYLKLSGNLVDLNWTGSYWRNSISSAIVY